MALIRWGYHGTEQLMRVIENGVSQGGKDLKEGYCETGEDHGTTLRPSEEDVKNTKKSD